MLDSSQGKIHATHTTQRALDMYFFSSFRMTRSRQCSRFLMRTMMAPWWKRGCLPAYSQPKTLSDFHPKDSWGLLGWIFGFKLGGGFKYFFYFHPYLGEDFQFDKYVSDGLKPPTSKVLSCPSLKGWAPFVGKVFREMIFPQFLGWTDLGLPQKGTFGKGKGSRKISIQNWEPVKYYSIWPVISRFSEGM